MTRRIVSLDTETGGTNERIHAFLECSAVYGDVDTELGTFAELGFIELFVRPHPKLVVEQEALKINRTDQRVPLDSERRVDESYVATWFSEQFQDPYWFGNFWSHNDEFDHRFIKAIYDRHSIQIPDWLGIISNIQCSKRTFRLMRFLGIHNWKKDSLRAVCNYYKIDRDGLGRPHSSLGDARATAHVIAREMRDLTRFEYL